MTHKWLAVLAFVVVLAGCSEPDSETVRTGIETAEAADSETPETADFAKSHDKHIPKPLEFENRFDWCYGIASTFADRVAIQHRFAENAKALAGASDQLDRAALKEERDEITRIMASTYEQETDIIREAAVTHLVADSGNPRSIAFQRAWSAYNDSEHIERTIRLAQARYIKLLTEHDAMDWIKLGSLDAKAQKAAKAATDAAVSKLRAAQSSWPIDLVNQPALTADNVIRNLNRSYGEFRAALAAMSGDFEHLAEEIPTEPTDSEPSTPRRDHAEEAEAANDLAIFFDLGEFLPLLKDAGGWRDDGWNQYSNINEARTLARQGARDLSTISIAAQEAGHSGQYFRGMLKITDDIRQAATQRVETASRLNMWWNPNQPTYISDWANLYGSGRIVDIALGDPDNWGRMRYSSEGIPLVPIGAAVVVWLNAIETAATIAAEFDKQLLQEVRNNESAYRDFQISFQESCRAS